MISPISLIKIDDIRDSTGKIFHIGQLPEYEQSDYDLSSEKSYDKFIKDVKQNIRTSLEYREMVKYLREYCGFDRSGISPNISNTDSKNVKIEIHHTPLTLEDIVRIVYEKRLFYHEDLSVQMVSKEVMECHYRCLVGLYPLTTTEHELVHNGYLFIPPSGVFGRYDLFLKAYDQFIDESDKEKIEEIQEYEKTFDPNEQNKILSQSNIYLDSTGVYELPDFSQFQQNVVQRIDTIRNNMYSLPVMKEIPDTSGMKEAIYFVNDKGERIDEPQVSYETE